MVIRKAETAALLTIIIVYSGLIRVSSRDIFRPPVISENITGIEGVIASSPRKTQSGKTYAVDVKISSVEAVPSVKYSPKARFQSPEPSGKAQHFGKARHFGIATLYVPAAKIEALYPGRLFSAARRFDAADTEKDKDSKYRNRLFDTGCKIYAPVSLMKFTSSVSQSPGKAYLQKLFPAKTGFYASDIFSENYTSKIFLWRALLRLQLKRLLYAWGEAGGLLLALLCGAKEYTALNLSEIFRKAGLSHILALSGMHLSLFSGLVKKVFSVFSEKRLQTVLSVLVAAVFVFFAGFTPSLTRAFICMLISAAASLFFFQPDKLTVLAISFLVQLCIFPQDADSEAFLLSYGAFLGIIAGEKLFTRFFNALLPFKLGSSVAVSLGAQLFTIPLSLLLFGEFAPAGFIASVIVSPFAGYFVTFGLISVFFTLLMPFLLKPLGVIIIQFYRILIMMVRFFSSFKD